MLKKIIAVSIISLLGFNTSLHAEKASVSVNNNISFFSKTMQKAGETRFIFGIGGGFSYLNNTKFSTSQVRYVLGDITTTEHIKNAINSDWSEGPLFAAYRTKYRYQIYPEIELSLRYMPKDLYYIQVAANWQFMNKKLQFANLREAKVVNTAGLKGEFDSLLKELCSLHPEVNHDINPLYQTLVAYIEGPDDAKIIKLRSRGYINFSAGKFITKTLCVGVEFGASIHGFKINDRNKAAIGFIAGVNFEHFFNGRLSLAGYTNYAFNTKKIRGARSIVRGVNFGGRIRCHF